MKRMLVALILFLVLALLALVIYYLPFRLHSTDGQGIHVPPDAQILGGFNIDTPQKAMRAAADGVKVVFKYGQPPSVNDSLGQALQSLHMKVIDGFISSSLFYYECHRTQTVKPPPPDQGQYCSTDEDPSMTDEQAVLSAVATHLQQVKDNLLVQGYWVLDDWVPWDPGSARQLLIDIHKLIARYTPGRPAICGFGASLDRWDDWVADNFSPQGCDMVGTYIYGPSVPAGGPAPSPDSYDWSMSSVLSSAFASLQRRGWDITREPLIGIGQAFGGARLNKNVSWLIPNAKNIETQSRSFCEHGASGVAFYGWGDTEFGPTTQTPLNSTAIETGIRDGIAACKSVWSI